MKTFIWFLVHLNVSACWWIHPVIYDNIVWHQAMSAQHPACSIWRGDCFQGRKKDDARLRKHGWTETRPAYTSTAHVKLWAETLRSRPISDGNHCTKLSACSQLMSNWIQISQWPSHVTISALHYEAASCCSWRSIMHCFWLGCCICVGIAL